MPEEKTNTNPEAFKPVVGNQGDLATQVDFFGPAKSTQKKIHGIKDADAYGDMNADAGDLSEKVFGKGNKEGVAAEDGYYEDSAGDDSVNEEDVSGALAESKDDNSEEVGNDEEEQDGESESDENADEGEKNEEETHDDSPKGYTLVEVDGEQIKIPDTTKIKVNIDGETQTFTLAKLKSIKSGEVNYHKRFEEVSKREKTLQAREINHDKEVNARTGEFHQNRVFKDTIVDAISKGDWTLAINEALAETNVEPGDFWDHFDRQNSEIYSQYNNLSEADRNAAAAWRRAKLKEIQLDRKEKRRLAADHEASLERDQQALIESQGGGISKADVYASWNELGEAAKAGRLDPELVKKLQQLDGNAKFRYALAYTVERRSEERISDFVKKVAPGSEEHIKTVINDLTEVMGAQKVLKASDEFLKKLIREKYGKKGASDNRKKVLGDKAQPRHKAASSKDNQGSAGSKNENFRPGYDLWGFEGQAFNQSHAARK